MMKINPNEADFSKWFRKNYNGWSERVEIAMGMSPGFADLMLLTPSGLFPCELKIGTVEDGILWSSEIRPSQIVWHRQLIMAGQQTMFCIGVWTDKGWQPYLFDGLIADQWETSGFKIGKDCFALNPKNLFCGVSEFIAREFEQ